MVNKATVQAKPMQVSNTLKVASFRRTKIYRRWTSKDVDSLPHSKKGGLQWAYMLSTRRYRRRSGRTQKKDLQLAHDPDFVKLRGRRV